MKKPTVHIQMVETEFRLPGGHEPLVRQGVSIQLDVEGKRYERVIPLPIDEEELRRYGFAPLTQN